MWLKLADIYFNVEVLQKALANNIVNYCVVCPRAEECIFVNKKRQSLRGSFKITACTRMFPHWEIHTRAVSRPGCPRGLGGQHWGAGQPHPRVLSAPGLLCAGRAPGAARRAGRQGAPSASGGAGAERRLPVAAGARAVAVLAVAGQSSGNTP